MCVLPRACAKDCGIAAHTCCGIATSRHQLAALPRDRKYAGPVAACSAIAATHTTCTHVRGRILPDTADSYDVYAARHCRILPETETQIHSLSDLLHNSLHLVPCIAHVSRTQPRRNLAQGLHFDLSFANLAMVCDKSADLLDVLTKRFLDHEYAPGTLAHEHQQLERETQAKRARTRAKETRRGYVEQLQFEHQLEQERPWGFLVALDCVCCQGRVCGSHPPSTRSPSRP